MSQGTDPGRDGPVGWHPRCCHTACALGHTTAPQTEVSNLPGHASQELRVALGRALWELLPSERLDGAGDGHRTRLGRLGRPAAHQEPPACSWPGRLIASSLGAEHSLIGAGHGCRTRLILLGKQAPDRSARPALIACIAACDRLKCPLFKQSTKTPLLWGWSLLEDSNL